MHPTNRTYVTIGVVAVIAATSVVAVNVLKPQQQTIQPKPQSASQSQEFKDGTYVVTRKYEVPGENSNELELSVTLKAGIITKATAKHSVTNKKSEQWVDFFDQGLKDAVEGKSIGTFSPGLIGGASVTSGAFNLALEAARKEARG